MRNGPSALPIDDKVTRDFSSSWCEDGNYLGKDNWKNYLCWQRIGRMWRNDQTFLVGDERNTRRFHSQKTVTQNEGWELYGRISCFQDTVDREG